MQQGVAMTRSRIGKKEDLSTRRIQDQLERILVSDRFRGSARQKKFLRFIVEQTLAGRGARLKGYTVGVEVFDRKENFDPQLDPIVRVEAGRLRRKLEYYYLTAGSDDSILITIPKGGYVPSFRAVHNGFPGSDLQDSRQHYRGKTTRPSVAVMPFSNLGGDQKQDYFVTGLTEELVVELSRYQEFKIIASQSTMRYRNQTFDPGQVGRA